MTAPQDLQITDDGIVYDSRSWSIVHDEPASLEFEAWLGLNRPNEEGSKAVRVLLTFLTPADPPKMEALLVVSEEQVQHDSWESIGGFVTPLPVREALRLLRESTSAL